VSVPWQQAIHFLFDNAVTLADPLFQRGPVNDGDVAAAVVDQAVLLQFSGGFGDPFAGNEIEKRMKTTRHYEVITRLESGGTQAVSYETDPGYKVGDRVRVENGTLVRNP
jgi:outer membrane lipoprotein SlyB